MTYFYSQNSKNYDNSNPSAPPEHEVLGHYSVGTKGVENTHSKVTKFAVEIFLLIAAILFFASAFVFNAELFLIPGLLSTIFLIALLNSQRQNLPLEPSVIRV